MTWYADAAIQVQNVVAQISTRLQNGGWTLYDNVAGSPVLSTTNNQGAACYLQVSQSGSYTYIQLQGFRSWNASTHVGTSGSSLSYARLYFGGSAQGATVTCDMYMTVTANRMWLGINTQSTNYRSWGYFGGLDTMAGTNDANCCVLISSYENASTAASGQMLGASGGFSASWGSCYWVSMWSTPQDNNASANQQGTLLVQGVPSDSGKIVIDPIRCCDTFLYASGWNAGIGPPAIRGNLDGVLWCPLGSASLSSTAAGGMLGHLDTITIGGTTYLVFQPGGTPTNQVHPWTGSYSSGIAIAES